MNDLNSVMERFIYYAKYGRAVPATKQTISTYIYGGRTLVRGLGNIKVTDISKQDIFIIKKHLLDKKCSQSYIHRILSLLKSVLQYCINEEKLSVYDPREIKVPPKTKKIVEYLEKDEMHRLFLELDGSNFETRRLKALCCLLIVSGMRLSEALELKISDVQGKMFKIVGKGRRVRVVFINDKTLYVINEYLSLREDNEPYLFISSKKPVRLTEAAATKQIHRFAKKLGMPKLKSHIFRRTFATNLNHYGASTRDIQNLLGHSTLQHTERYLGLDYLKLGEVHEKYIDMMT